MNICRGGGSCGQSIFSLVGRNLSAQEKVDGAHSIESGVWGPHGREYFTHGADVLLHNFFNGLLLDCKYSCAYLVKNYFEGMALGTSCRGVRVVFGDIGRICPIVSRMWCPCGSWNRRVLW